MRLKRLSRISPLLLIVFLLAVSGSVAYYVTTETAHNVVSMSGVDIELYELADPSGNESTLTPFTNLEKVLPGTTYSKIPYIENVDTQPVWVRAKLTLSKTLADDSEVIIEDGASVMELGGIGENWTRGEDGFYYYGPALEGGKSTEPIFRTVKFTDEIADEHQDAVYFTLKVDADATQYVNNGTTAKDANWTES
ncbi:hypothetical protein IKG20_00135 [Candidatus Saccharibacteria bacterium]|nr:hypothetical protein [Candidatus Saccharibacteria bacterium]